MGMLLVHKHCHETYYPLNSMNHINMSAAEFVIIHAYMVSPAGCMFCITQGVASWISGYSLF